MVAYSAKPFATREYVGVFISGRAHVVQALRRSRAKSGRLKSLTFTWYQSKCSMSSMVALIP